MFEFKIFMHGVNDGERIRIHTTKSIFLLRHTSNTRAIVLVYFAANGMCFTTIFSLDDIHIEELHSRCANVQLRNERNKFSCLFCSLPRFPFLSLLDLVFMIMEYNFHKC